MMMITISYIKKHHAPSVVLSNQTESVDILMVML